MIRLHRSLSFASFTAASLACCVGTSAHAALFAYDGFEAGGSTPGAGQYTTGTGYGSPGDALVAGGNNNTFQGPTTTGFDAGTPWAGGSFLAGGGFASTVYYQVNETGLTYSDGANQLTTLDGGVRHLHEATPANKSVSRELVNKPTPGTLSYFSLLMRYESEDNNWNSTAQVGLEQGTGQTTVRNATVGINTAGQLELKTSYGSGTTTVGSSLTQDQDHFIVVRYEELSGNDDSIHVWLDPDLDAEPTLGTADISLTSTYIYVSGNANFKFDRIAINAELDNTSASNPEDFVYFDEFRLGETYADVTPFVPEPSSLALLGLGGIMAARRRRV